MNKLIKQDQPINPEDNFAVGIVSTDGTQDTLITGNTKHLKEKSFVLKDLLSELNEDNIDCIKLRVKR